MPFLCSQIYPTALTWVWRRTATKKISGECDKNLHDECSIRSSPHSCIVGLHFIATIPRSLLKVACAALLLSSGQGVLEVLPTT
mmetsp:Transcript_781/g.4865  ORF Transcript_781/g.4865 Transcript_781/m.4865 type:complete len:84 (+) Transcript_781:2720-2971(+)